MRFLIGGLFNFFIFIFIYLLLNIYIYLYQYLLNISTFLDLNQNLYACLVFIMQHQEMCFHGPLCRYRSYGCQFAHGK